jgi:hypothetical protein
VVYQPGSCCERGNPNDQDDDARSSGVTHGLRLPRVSAGFQVGKTLVDSWRCPSTYSNSFRNSPARRR